MSGSELTMSELTRCEACSLPLSDDPELWHSIHPRVDLPDATEANEWAQDHQGEYHQQCCPLCKKENRWRKYGNPRTASHCSPARYKMSALFDDWFPEPGRPINYKTVEEFHAVFAGLRKLDTTELVDKLKNWAEYGDPWETDYGLLLAVAERLIALHEGLINCQIEVDKYRAVEGSEQ